MAGLMNSQFLGLLDSFHMKPSAFGHSRIQWFHVSSPWSQEGRTSRCAMSAARLPHGCSMIALFTPSLTACLGLGLGPNTGSRMGYGIGVPNGSAAQGLETRLTGGQLGRAS